MKPMTSRYAAIESRYCPNSTDGGGAPANHYIKDGACAICDRTPHAIAVMHGLDLVEG